jgi:hypothetical protein
MGSLSAIEALHQATNWLGAHPGLNELMIWHFGTAEIVGDAATRVLAHRLIVHLKHQPVIALLPLFRPSNALFKGLQIQSGDFFEVRNDNPNNATLLEHAPAVSQEPDGRCAIKVL